MADLCGTKVSWHPGFIPATESRLKRCMVHWTATRSRHAAQGCRALASAPLGIASPIVPIVFPDRNAVPSRALRWRRDVR